MGGIFNFDSSFMQFLGKAADMLILSMLWILGCLPVLTIGTSTTALYYASIKAVKDEGSAVKNFFKSYRENLKQSILAELLLLLFAYILFLDIQIIYSMQGILGEILKVMFWVVFFAYIAVLNYIFTLLSRFVYTLPALFRNAFLISMMNLPYTLAIIFLNLLPLIVFIWQPLIFMWLLPLFLFIAPGAIARVNTLLFLRIFRKFTPESASDET